jgi:hypothetical protein
MDSFGKTNRERLEDMWKTLNDKLPDDGRIREYLRAHDAAGRALKAKGAINNNEKAASKPAVAQDECAQDVYKHGQSIGLFDIPKETANVICAGITAVTGARVDWHYIAGRVHMKALTASPAAPAQSGEPVYAYIYEYETAFGLHRQLEPGTYNGSNPTRTVKVYASPQPVAQTERALTDDARDAARYRWLRDPMSEWSTLFAEPIKWDGGGWARISSRWINDYFDKAVDGAIAAQPASGDAQ